MNFKQLWSLTVLCLSHLLFVIPTYRATHKTIKVCDQKFKGVHHKNGQANAFRHALWNIFIIYKCKQWSSVGKATAWAKRITDWHEDFLLNAPLERAMDLHNNKIGRNFFIKHQDANEEQLIQLLIALLPLSRKIHAVKQIQNHPDTLIHLEDD
ncbi:hypothetical protein GTQ40_12310 [Flavobacteriaceae bacterium R38]|nr:hypothetical protein [Flavobacteriaceae bacterium R38]